MTTTTANTINAISRAVRILWTISQRVLSSSLLSPQLSQPSQIKLLLMHRLFLHLNSPLEQLPTCNDSNNNDTNSYNDNSLNNNTDITILITIILLMTTVMMVKMTMTMRRMRTTQTMTMTMMIIHITNFKERNKQYNTGNMLLVYALECLPHAAFLVSKFIMILQESITL